MTQEQIDIMARRLLRYDELLYAVQSKFPGESRHETALRYIRERENAPAAPTKQRDR